MGDLSLYGERIVTISAFVYTFLFSGRGSIMVGRIVLFLTFRFPNALSVFKHGMFIEFWIILKGMRFFVVDISVVRFRLSS